ncbi:hypothetical protein [Parabacteroides sp.]
MDIFDLLFGWGGQAMRLIFQYGFIPKEEDFLELTDEQYVQFHIKMGECNEKIFMIAPVDPRNAVEADSTELPIVTESQRNAFLEAAKDIERYCEGKDLHTDEEKLRFAARHMPNVFSKGSKYEKYSKFTVTKRQKDK